MKLRQPNYRLIVLTAILCFATVCARGQTRTVKVSGQSLPASNTAPSCFTSCSALATSGVSVDILIISNKDTSDHTVTITDCSGTPFLLFNGAAITAKQTWIVPLGGMQFVGCFKWSADSTQVFGTMVGRQ